MSDNPACFALLLALRARVPAVVIDPKRFSPREGFDRELARVVDKAKVELIALAGFMRILSPWFVRRYKGRILNIHPALLPAFPGAHGVKEALSSGVKMTGVTVHFVDEKVDRGPIIAQFPVPVREEDTQESLLARIHRVEHRLYPKVIGWVLRGSVKMTGRKVRFVR